MPDGPRAGAWPDGGRPRRGGGGAAPARPGPAPTRTPGLVTADGLGFDRAAISGRSGRAPRTVGRRLAAFAAGGVDALADSPRAGRPPTADVADIAELGGTVGTPPRDLELWFAAWTSGRLAASLKETTGIAVAPGWRRVLRHRRGFACGRPKHPLAHLLDPAAIAACAEALRAAGENGAG